MSTGTLTYGTVANMTITMVSIPPSGYWQSLPVENSVSALDVLVGGAIQVAAATSIDGAIEFYAYGSYDASAYTAGVNGTNTSITWGTHGNTGVDGYQDLPYLGRTAVDATDVSDTKYFGPFSIASAFGGVLPRRWGLVVRNNQTTPTHGTGGGNHVQYTPVKIDIA